MKIDKEIAHPIHAQHKLKLEYTEIPFKCDGCKEAGIGLKYKCQQAQAQAHAQAHARQKISYCEFELHKICAVAPSTITHPFYNKCEFEFYYEPLGPEKRICDACRNEVIGFVYHCKRCDFDLHPCCANLPQVLEDGERRRLYLSMKLISSPCLQCGNRGLGWSYRSECKTYNLHVSCVKELLVERWQVMYLNKDKDKDKHKKLRELQTRIPSLKPRHHNNNSSASGGKVMMMSKAAAAIRVIVSAILGDPTAVIAAVVAGLISK